MKCATHVLTGLALALFVTIVPALASQLEAYSADRFAKAQAEGDPIVVDISASWCPVCKAQGMILETDLAKPGFSRFVRFNIDFDTQKDAVRQFGADMQSTLIIFKGKKEVARLIGGTDSQVIEAMLRRGLN